MRIRSVEACQPISKNSPPDWRTSFGQILVTVTAEDGTVGYGVGGGGLSGIHIVNALFREQLIGRDVEQIESIWKRLHKSLLTVGQSGIGMMALSGVDLALWDLQGHLSHQPVARLLSSDCDFESPIPTYQTVWGEVPEEVSRASSGVKLHLGTNGKSDATLRDWLPKWIEETRKAREKIGADRDLMVDAWMSWDVETALAFAHEVSDLQLVWLEEPLPLDDHEGYARLRDECPVTISGGEHLYSLAEFEASLQRGDYQILQPDVCWMVGLTPLLQLIELAQDRQVKVVPHRGSEVWALHAIAALPIERLAESGRPWMQWVIRQPEIRQGTIQITDLPGFGVRCDPDAPCVREVLRSDQSGRFGE
ncbi:L-rhamnonate dehydratase [Thalassoglobus neptunius]|uniref:L-rhamnonate dehydratase n=1 Tax=Thalassoglobus neptunius TaxID=1938619 RepID=A0A5C5VRD1_9PLAN|nr:mandelate racemase/muconate lactonizing enzyme family protein [Thalassoglobus neptunius]TWT40717.1 L-rhamnonate dehydratase [Thalassoglobus neptunius]